MSNEIDYFKMITVPVRRRSDKKIAFDIQIYGISKTDILEVKIPYKTAIRRLGFNPDDYFVSLEDMMRLVTDIRKGVWSRSYRVTP
jgi:hypothetical protein